MNCNQKRKGENIASISELKVNLQKLIENIDELDEIESHGRKPLSDEDVQQKIKYTSALLDKFDNASLTKLKKTAAKRKKKRKTQKKNGRRVCRPKSSFQSRKSDSPSTSQPNTCQSLNDVACLKSSPIKKSTISCKCKDAKTFLKTFELLEKLHFIRTQNIKATNKLSARLNDLRTIWNNVLIENTPKLTQLDKIEKQWDQVFFGVSGNSYNPNSDKKLNDFLSIRHTWDSHLTRNETLGSHIPLGWVLPNENALESWAAYRTE